MTVIASAGIRPNYEPVSVSVTHRYYCVKTAESIAFISVDRLPRPLLHCAVTKFDYLQNKEYFPLGLFSKL